MAKPCDQFWCLYKTQNSNIISQNIYIPNVAIPSYLWSLMSAITGAYNAMQV